LFTQIVGKLRLSMSAPVNHWWHVTLYVTPRGLTTGPIPHARGIFDLEFDLIDHVLRIRTSAGEEERVSLQGRSVAEFYTELMGCLRKIGVEAHIHAEPFGIAVHTPFLEDTEHRTYDPEYADRFRRVLIQCDTAFR